MKNVVTFIIFLLLFLGLSLLEADHALGLYGLVLLVYLFSKMILSFVYKPFGGSAKDYKVDCIVPTAGMQTQQMSQTRFIPEIFFKWIKQLGSAWLFLPSFSLLSMVY